MIKWRCFRENFYQEDTETVARELLGHYLVRNMDSGPCGGMIVETEAYLADDPACHAFTGLSHRNKTMWGPPGRAYVYLIYGFHHCINAVCRPEGTAEAVLIRAIEPVFGRDQMQKRRTSTLAKNLSNGPGKLCQALEIDLLLDGANLCRPESPVFIAENADREIRMEQSGPVVKTTRIGISKAADKLLRFYLQKNDWISRKK